MTFGYCGQILRVNLSKIRFTVEKNDEKFYRRYFGGSALIAYYLLTELEPGVDPLSPENILVFSSGVMTGHPFSGSGRNSVGAKSPLTNGFGTSEVGGYWGSMLKHAGFDGIIMEGKAEKPSYLWIKDGEYELREAGHLWGKPTLEVETSIKEELKDKTLNVCQIGPAGERLIRYANITNDLSHFAGRTGLGAVMGSKNMRGIAVKGTKPPGQADPAYVKETAKKIAVNVDKELPLGRTLGEFRKTGTGGGLLGLNASGGLPTRNFQEGVFEKAEEIDGQKMLETILTGRHTCYACALNCKRTVQVKEPFQVNPLYGGPEYETLASFGSNCGIDDLKAIAKGNEICNSNGLDTISAGVTIAFAMECYEKGLLTEEKTGGLKLKFGDPAALLKALELITQQKGLGRLLGEGVKRASEKIGGGSERHALHVKGLEIPMHEPRLKKGIGIGYAVSPTGADHCHNLHDTLYKGEGEQLAEARALGVLKPLPANLLNPDKIRLLIYASTWRHFTNSAVICYFTPHYYANTPALMNAITNWNTTTWELMKVGERSTILARLFNIREGLTRKDDQLPERFATPFKEGPTAGESITPSEVEEMKEVYYTMMGWDSETGIPTKEKLHELDLGWATKYI